MQHCKILKLFTAIITTNYDNKQSAESNYHIHEPIIIIKYEKLHFKIS